MKHAYARDAEIIEIGLLKSEDAVEGVAEQSLTEPQISPSSHPNEKRVSARLDEGQPSPAINTA